MELIRNHIPTEDAARFIDLPFQDQVIALRRIAAEKVREQLDPIQQAQQELLNGIV
jgi:hypothetical protein